MLHLNLWSVKSCNLGQPSWNTYTATSGNGDLDGVPSTETDVLEVKRLVWRQRGLLTGARGSLDRQWSGVDGNLQTKE